METDIHILPPSDPRIAIQSPDRCDMDGRNDSNMNDATSQLPQATMPLTVEQTIRNTRLKLEEYIIQAARNNQGSSDETLQLARDVVNIPCPLGMKYSKLDFPELLRTNYSKLGQDFSSNLLTALGILEKYGTNLLKINRPAVWRSVRFSNAIFRTKVDVVDGAREILRQLGYTEDVEDGLAYPQEIENPNVAEVAKITADLIVAKQEIEAIQKNSHPQPNAVKQYKIGGGGSHSTPGSVRLLQQRLSDQLGKVNQVPPGGPGGVVGGVALPGMVPKTVSALGRRPAPALPVPGSVPDQSIHKPQHSSLLTDAPNKPSPELSTSGGDLEIKRPPPDVPGVPPKKVVPPKKMAPPRPMQKSATDIVSRSEGKSAAGVVTRSVADEGYRSEGLTPTKLSLPPVDEFVPIKSEVAEETLCDLCGQFAAMKLCDECGDKRCDECDDRWHQHAMRKSHTRRPISTVTQQVYENTELLSEKKQDAKKELQRSRSDLSKRPVPAPRTRTRQRPLSGDPQMIGREVQTLPYPKKKKVPTATLR